MAKIIIELDDDFIRENADPKRIARNMRPDGKGADVIRSIYEGVAYSAVAKRIDEGQSEFRVAREMFDDDHRYVWDSNIPDVLVLAFMAETGTKKEDEGK